MGENEVLSMNATQLIEWCKERKNSLNLSNQKLSEMTGVPIGTIDRIMAGKYNEYRYSSIQPVVAVLLGFNKATPEPDADEKQGKYYYDTIEGYKLVLDNKNREIDELKRAIENLKRELDFVKHENTLKQGIIENYHEHVEWLRGVVDKAITAAVK